MSKSDINQMELKKKKYKFLLSSICIVLAISYTLLIYFTYSIISGAYQTDGLLATITIIFRISILVSCTFYLLHKWFRQEAIYPSDAYFLFALFFIILIMGKGIDLYISLIFLNETFDINYLLVFFKLRYIIIIINALPLLYLGLEVIINIFDAYVKNISKQKSNTLKIAIIFAFSFVITAFILFSTSLQLILNVLPIVTTLTMIGIIILFVMMYRIKRLSQANGLIIGLGFILVVISSIFRPSLTKDLDISVLILAELIDQAIYILIFAGFIKKPPYAKQTYIEVRKSEVKEVF